MFVGLTALTLSIADRSLRWLRRCGRSRACSGCCVLVLPWFIAIVAASGDSFFAESLGHDMLDKITSGQEAHGAPPGFYLLLFWVTFWPGAILAGLAVPAIWAARREPGRALPAGLDRTVLDRVRGGDDQAAALRAAALSGHRHSDRRHHRGRRAVPQSVAGARHRRVVSVSRRSLPSPCRSAFSC